MNYSSYLGSKKCNNVICIQGEPGPRGPPGPPGPSGNVSNSFTIISSIVVNDISNNILIWNIDIPFIYGQQFTFTFNSIDINVKPLNIESFNLPSNKLTTISSYSYIFGIGQAVYQSYTIDNNINNINYGYIPVIVSNQGTGNLPFYIIITVETNNTITYKFVYEYDITTMDYLNLINSKIKLNGVKYN
jgi:hypothetical protein